MQASRDVVNFRRGVEFFANFSVFECLQTNWLPHVGRLTS